MRYDLVLFDLDGTLIDSRDDIATTGNAVRAGLGLPPRPPAELHGFIGEGLARFVSRALDLADDDPSLEAGIESFREHYAVHCLDETRPFEGVREALDELRRAGLRLAIVTNKPGRFTEIVVDGLDLRAGFELIVSADTTARRKPDPLPVHHILDATGVAPDRSVLVGDSAVDVATARNSGVALGVVTWGIGDAEHLRAAGAEHVFERPAELASLAR